MVIYVHLLAIGIWLSVGAVGGFGGPWDAAANTASEAVVMANRSKLTGPSDLWMSVWPPLDGVASLFEDRSSGSL